MGRFIQQHSAGGVVLKGLGDDLCVLLIKPAGRDRWQLPKGQIDGDESPEVAAVREVREEGGVQAEILGKLEPVVFFYQMGGRRFVKTVDFFVMRYQAGSPHDHDHEVDESRWFTLDEALNAITFDTERAAVTQAAEQVQTKTLSIGKGA